MGLHFLRELRVRDLSWMRGGECGGRDEENGFGAHFDGDGKG
jgi:hypothetical protein